MVRRIMLIAALAASIPGMAFSQNLNGILRGTPFAEFRGDDSQIFRSTLVRAAEGPAGESLQWSNPKTTAQGSVRLLKSYERADIGTCRDLGGQSTARGRTSSFQVTVCRKPGDPKWWLAS